LDDIAYEDEKNKRMSQRYQESQKS